MRATTAHACHVQLLCVRRGSHITLTTGSDHTFQQRFIAAYPDTQALCVADTLLRVLRLLGRQCFVVQVVLLLFFVCTGRALHKQPKHTHQIPQHTIPHHHTLTSKQAFTLSLSSTVVFTIKDLHKDLVLPHTST